MNVNMKDKSIRKRVLLYSVEIIFFAVFGTAMIMSARQYKLFGATAWYRR